VVCGSLHRQPQAVNRKRKLDLASEKLDAVPKLWTPMLRSGRIEQKSFDFQALLST
jgi:hypothetical protein